ncbi:transglycosylase domain-containing protein [Timonella senegalensis]|uniref:transglycosylase domain-containing protein n=1 Tax=Timonella senegalensis TaxID=1465825 RepID=UPI0028A94775|nr:transglycosylase domain-containing protein [Timonella senegalensis]
MERSAVARSNNGRLTQVSRPKKRRLIDYPRYGKRGIRRWIPSWRFVLGTFLTFFALGVGVFIAAYNSVTVPDDASSIAMQQTTTVYYADGKRVLGEFSQVDRKIIDTTAIPEHVGQAVVAAEDRTFYKNSGIDVKGMARALYINITQGKRQGGSTITQQFAERYYMGTNTSYAGKIKETLLALKLGQEKDKAQVLDGYMNTIYFGRGAFGIEMAAQRYFGIPASKLTVEQAALIAGVIPSPTNWDPQNNPEKAESRWNYVLDGMVSLGFITQADRANMEFPETIEYDKTNRYQGVKGYLLDGVRKEVLSKVDNMTEDDLDTGGYKIISTFDYAAQKDLQAAMKTMPDGASKNLRAAGVTIDPKTGGVVAMYGGKDYLKQQFNNATQGSAQAGSTFKPITLLAALEQGYSLDSYYNGNNGRAFDDNGTEWKPNNFGMVNWGWISLTKAIANSVNSVFVELNQQVTPQATVDAAVSIGIPKSTPDLNPVLSNVLGSATVRPIDLANAYATFAANGKRHDAHMVAKVKNADGSTRYEPNIKGKKAYDAAVGAELTYALSQVVEQGSATKAKVIGHPIAGKTGTSNDNKSAWFVGYTPSYATAISLYQSSDSGSQESITPFGGYNEITGGSVPLDIWTTYMGRLLADKPVEQFPDRTYQPTMKPTPTPTPTQTATEEPTEEPTTEEPTEEPTTEEPTAPPTTQEPTEPPVTQEPTDPPTTQEPTTPPVDPPTGPTDKPKPPGGGGGNSGGSGGGAADKPTG